MYSKSNTYSIVKLTLEPRLVLSSHCFLKFQYVTGSRKTELDSSIFLKLFSLLQLHYEHISYALLDKGSASHSNCARYYHGYQTESSAPVRAFQKRTGKS
jgi:hypothetical protein